MSVQFGRWNFAGEKAAPEYLEKVRTMLAPYGPDSDESYSQDGTTILYRGVHTTKESRREKQPAISQSGAVLTWDGRLDNRHDLIGELHEVLTREDSDLAIVATAWERWGTNCFAKLIGDWALAVWDPGRWSLILAKDPIGPRHLYYSFDDKQITWCTVLDPLVLVAANTFTLCGEYIAGWLSMYPATHVTPYVGISSVPPSSCVFLGPRKHIVAKYWDFDPSRRIRYRTDAEYEEHFRSVFFKAVQRRLRSHAPVLAELSGGRDSSSIVCVADEIIARGEAETPRLDTISYYDDSEPNWNERPYFNKVEQKRGRIGWHVDVSLGIPRSSQVLSPTLTAGGFLPTPSYLARAPRQLKLCLASQNNRVLLSGIGGDEVMGGVPTPVPEIQDLVVTGQVRELAHQLKLWAVEKRKPWFYLFFDALREFLPPGLAGLAQGTDASPCVCSAFVRRHWPELHGFPCRIQFLGPLPTFQHNLGLLDAVRRQIACRAPQADPPFEKGYPFLDRDFLEFVFAIPRQQLVRPIQRRSLMRRALAGIVPEAILNRKTKAFVARSPLLRISRDWHDLDNTTRQMLSDSLGIIDASALRQALARARDGQEGTPRSLMRAIFLERWLRTVPCVESTKVQAAFLFKNASTAESS